MTKKLFINTVGLVLLISVSRADTLVGFNAVTFDTTDSGNQFMTGLTYDSVTYTTNDFVFGKTDRYYNLTAGGTALWAPELSEFPADGTEIPDTSFAKQWDIGSKADNILWSVTPPPDGNQPPDMASLDALPYLQTIFTEPVTEIFLFERGTGDQGTALPILSADGLTLGTTPLTLNYAPVGGIEVNGQGVMGFVYKADSPIWGIRVSAPGLDAMSILAAKPYEPPPLPEIGPVAFEVVDDGSTTVLTWTNAAAAGNYHVLQTADLVGGNWSTSAPMPGVDGPMSVTNSTSAPRSFYKVIGEHK